MIKGLLDAAHLEKNKLGLKFGLTSICDILSRSVQDINMQAKEKEISIVQDIHPLPKIWGDEERLTQVMVNLLVNAIKFTPQKGTITITASDGKTEIKISVSDTGIGIPEHKITRIFDRFYQIDGSDNRKYGGVGLGLSICKSIIEKHYGSIWAQSSGNGSTFHVVLPKLMQDKEKESGRADD
ncbi:Methyl sulfide methyltransferase-associated sensor [uncultured archaeon]|nr:Methyl sulfide methyltransferase-associated sensor [uncultured archaeon]